MSRGRRHDTNKGPQFKTMHREDKVKEWSHSIQAILRHYDGTDIPDKEAIDYADQFWLAQLARQEPIKEIAATGGIRVAAWVLSTYRAGLATATAFDHKEPE